MKLSRSELQSLLKICTSRIDRLRHFDTSHKIVQAPRSHAFNLDTVIVMKYQYYFWEQEK